MLGQLGLNLNQTMGNENLGEGHLAGSNGVLVLPLSHLSPLFSCKIRGLSILIAVRFECDRVLWDCCD